MTKLNLALTVLLLSVGLITNGQTVKIGSANWADKNLAVSQFRNGDNIPEVKTDEEWAKFGEQKKPAWCYYQNDSANGTKYGKLYNWYAVNDKRGLAPAGWHIATDDEWQLLIDALGGDEAAGIKMKNTTGWKNNGNGNNSAGFNGLAAGARNYDGSFAEIGNAAFWWTFWVTKARMPFSPTFRFLTYDDNTVGRDNSNQGNGYTVRCIKE
jgi:uncharacterized protein (TIGR02145 family)